MKDRSESVDLCCSAGRDAARYVKHCSSSHHSLWPEEQLKFAKEDNAAMECPTAKATLNDSLFQSPSRSKTYEIKARSVWYRISKRKSSERGPGSLIEHCDKFILKNVSCDAKPAEILAIAGPSGAGKSTLLEVLAGRIRPSGPADSVLVNKQPMVLPFFRRISGYITQDDSLFPLLTVEETLMFSACLRLPSSVAKAEKKQRVHALMTELGLQHVAKTRIGNEEIRGVSGGERRRVSIGVDVIHDPAVLLLDEPTSGLDSAAALNTIEMLHTMAKSRSRTIILSIHQPSYRILQLVDSILLLANGSVVHHGPLQLLHQRLIAVGHKIPDQINVLEYAIDTIAAGSDMKFLDPVESIHIPENSFRNEGFLDSSGDPQAKDLESCITVQIKKKTWNLANDNPAFANTNLSEIMVLSRRFGKIIYRTKQLFAARIIQALVAGFGLGSIYINLGFNQRGTEERLGFFAFTLTYLLSSTVEALPIFLQERQILFRETSRGAYRISSYIISNTLVFLPFLLIVAGLYSIPVYWLVGLSRTWSTFLFFVLVIWLIVLMANSFVAFLSALVPNYIMGNSVISGCMGAFFLFSGYFISKESIPAYWIFMHYFSLFKYPLDALLINEYSSSKGKCFGLQNGGVCTVTSDMVLRELGLEKESKWLNVAIMFFFIFGYRVLCFLVLKMTVCKPKR